MIEYNPNVHETENTYPMPEIVADCNDCGCCVQTGHLCYKDNLILSCFECSSTNYTLRDKI